MKEDKRTIITVPLNKHTETLMAYTYGHMIPLRSEFGNGKGNFVTLKIDDSVPSQILDQAKTTCIEGSKRYYTNVLNKTPGE